MQGCRRDEASGRFTGVRHLTHRTQDRAVVPY